MGFKDRYVGESDKQGNESKKVISDEAYALGELLVEIAKMLRRMR